MPVGGLGEKALEIMSQAAALSDRQCRGRWPNSAKGSLKEEKPPGLSTVSGPKASTCGCL